MQLKSLSIEGFRGFKDRQEIIFPENGEPLVILGVNGAGKTAVLEAIRAAVAPFVLDLEDYHYTNELPDSTIDPEKYLKRAKKELALQLTANDIHISLKQAKINLRWGHQSGDSSVLTGEQLDLRRYKGLEIQALSYGTYRMALEFLDKEKKPKLPVISYYASDRNIRESSLAFLEEGSETSLYTNALTTGPVNFKRFFSWYRFTEDIENEQRLGQEDFSYKHPQLEAVRQAIMQMMGDEFKDLRIQRSPYVDMILKKQGAQLSVMQLSSGEKALLALAGDLAMRLALANEGEEHPLRGTGVVMIDEIDLHLHPSWQRKVVSRLRQTFPNIQFILTTHSPLIINRLPAESLYYLDNQQCFAAKDAPEQFRSYGANIAKILSWQGGEHILHQAATEAINEIGMLIQDDEIEAAKAALNELKSKIDPNHPDLVNLETDLELKVVGN